MVSAVLGVVVAFVFEPKWVIIILLEYLGSCRYHAVVVAVGVGQPNVPQVIFILIHILKSPCGGWLGVAFGGVEKLQRAVLLTAY